jgi:hypothetical protein
MEILRAFALVLVGLLLLGLGLRVLTTGTMRVRKSRPQDSAAVLRNSAFTGSSARSRGVLFAVVGGTLAALGCYGLLTGGL